VEKRGNGGIVIKKQGEVKDDVLARTCNRLVCRWSYGHSFCGDSEYGEGLVMCNLCLSEDEYDMRHSLSRRERLQRDPDYGDWLLEQEKDRKQEEVEDATDADA